MRYVLSFVPIGFIKEAENKKKLLETNWVKELPGVESLCAMRITSGSMRNPYRVFKNYGRDSKDSPMRVNNGSPFHTCRETLLYSMNVMNNIYKQMCSQEILVVVEIQQLDTKERCFEFLQKSLFPEKFKVFLDDKNLSVQFFFSDGNAILLSMYLFMIRHIEEFESVLKRTEESKSSWENFREAFFREASMSFLENEDITYNSTSEAHFMSYYCYSISKNRASYYLSPVNGPNLAAKYYMHLADSDFLRKYVKNFIYPVYKKKGERFLNSIGIHTRLLFSYYKDGFRELEKDAEMREKFIGKTAEKE
jgi:hypothetical protein